MVGTIFVEDGNRTGLAAKKIILVVTRDGRINAPVIC